MNFFGHAAFARRRDPAPAFALGAMLPDLVNLVGTRVPRVEHEQARRGLGFHFASDAAFHDAPTFHELSRAAHAELAAAGVRRGPARAVAHVGVELLYDGALAADVDHRAGYVAALAVIPDVAPALVWPGADDAPRFLALGRALDAYGVDSHVVGVDVLVARLRRILASRPRLALAPHELPAVLAWAERARVDLVQLAPRLTREVEQALPVPP